MNTITKAFALGIILSQFSTLALPLLTIGQLGRSISWNNQIITSPLTYNNESIICDGNLTINAGGSLSLIDSELIINPKADLSSIINVNNGGEFYLYNSKMYSNNSFGYSINLNSGSKCHFDKSEIRDFGSVCGTFLSGISSVESELTIEHSVLFVKGYGIQLQYATFYMSNSTIYPATVDQNGIISCYSTVRSIASNILIDNSTIYGALNNTKGYENIPLFSLMGTVRIQNVVTFQCKNYLLSLDSAMFSNVTMYVNNTTSPALFISGINIIFSNCRFGNGLGDGIECLNSNVSMFDSDLNGERTALVSDDNSQSITDKNIINMVNSKYDSYVIKNELSKINDFHYLNIKVFRESDGTGMEGIAVNVSDKSNKPVFSGVTNMDGLLNGVMLGSRIITKSFTSILTPHKVNILNGDLTVATRTVDMNNNQNISIMIDDIPPKLNVSYPYDWLKTNASMIYITGTSDLDADILINDNEIQNDNGAFNSSYWLEEGLNVITVTARDITRNQVNVTVNVVCKTIPPSLDVTEPVEGTITNQDRINVIGNTNGTKIEINGIPGMINSGHFNCSFNLTHEGDLTITIVARDEVGNSRIIVRKIRYDNTPPPIEIISPINGSWINSNNIDIRLRALGAVNVKIDKKSTPPDDTGFVEYRKSLSEGRNLIIISALDQAGNENTTTLVIFLDSSNSLDVLEPTEDILINESEVVITGITESEAYVSINGLPVINRDGNFTFTLMLDEGMNRVNVTSIDRAGNRAETIFKVTVDSIKPVIDLISPIDKVSSVANIELKLKIEEGANVTMNGAFIQGSGDIYVFETTLQKGDNTFTISAKDPAGNINTTEIVITYKPPKKPEPDPTKFQGILLPIALASIFIVIVTITVLILRRKKMRGST
jgi:hypothetical protein